MDLTTPVLARLDAHETLLARRAAVLEQQLEELTAELHEITSKREDLRVTRKTLIELDADVPIPPQTPRPHEALPENPAYGEILDALHNATSPLRARAVCEALDLGTSATAVNGMRHKLKRMVDRGVLAEPEIGLFAIRRTTETRETDIS